MRLGLGTNELWWGVATDCAVSREEANSSNGLGPSLVTSAPVDDAVGLGAKTTSDSVLGIIGLTVVAGILGLSFYWVVKYLL
jgi:hypothetical protein